MANEAVKTELAQATTMPERARAVEQAIALGMPLDQIENYLDWLDAVRPLSDYASPEPAAEEIAPDNAGGAEPSTDAVPVAPPESGPPNPIEKPAEPVASGSNPGEERQGTG